MLASTNSDASCCRRTVILSSGICKGSKLILETFTQQTQRSCYC
jgi:hypothetical protein